MKKVIYALIIVVCIFFLFRTNDKTVEKQTFSFEDLPEFVGKIGEIPDDADFILHFRHRVFLTSNEELFLEKYGDARYEKVENLQIGHKDMFDIRTYRTATEEERDIAFKAKENLEYTNLTIEKAMPGGDAYYLEFYWDDEMVRLHLSAGNGSIFEDIMVNGERQVTWVQFKAPHSEAACELFESLYEN